MADSTQTATSAASLGLEESSLLDSILAETKLGPSDGDAYELVRNGTRKLLDDLLRSENRAPKIDKELINGMLADIDRRLSAQINEILHAEPVQKLESAWRGLRHLVDQVDFRENVRVEFVNASK